MSGRKQFSIWQRDKVKVLTDQFYFLVLRLDMSILQDTDKYITFKNTFKKTKTPEESEAQCCVKCIGI